MSSTVASTAEFQDGGRPVANPIYIVDINGNPVSGTNPSGATAANDNVPPTTVSEVAVGLYNSSTNQLDRLRDVGSLGDSYTIGMIGAAQFLFNGGSFDRARTPTTFLPIAAVAITAGTPVAIWTPTGGRKFHLMGYCVTSTVAASILFKDGSAEILRVPVLAGGAVNSPPFGNGYTGTVANQALFCDVTVTGIISGFCYGTQEF